MISASPPTGAASLVYPRTIGESTAVWPEPSTHVRALTRNDWLFAIAVSACISAGVSLLTLWLWGQSQAQGTASAPGTDPVGVMTVTYEPLESASPARSGDLAEAFEPSERQEQPLAPASPEDEAQVRDGRQYPNALPVQEPARARSRPIEAGPDAAQTARTTSLGPGAAARPKARLTGFERRRDNTLPAGNRDDTVVRAAAANGRSGLIVISQPEGARVTINGLSYGATPLTVAHLPPGTKRIRVSKTGYESEERVVGADTDRTAVTLRIALRETPAIHARQ